jgi:transglutaminase-like putative cysteine protease
MNIALSEISSGEAGTDQTVGIIQSLVSDALSRSQIRLFTISILDRANYPGHDVRAAAEIIYNWVSQNIKFVDDPIDLETVQSPEVTVRLKAGDCDDHVALLSAMLQSIGIPVRYVVIGSDRESFSHIYIEALISGKWTSIDSTIPPPMGRVGRLNAKKIYNARGLSGESDPSQTVSSGWFFSGLVVLVYFLIKRGL